MRADLWRCCCRSRTRALRRVALRRAAGAVPWPGGGDAARPARRPQVRAPRAAHALEAPPRSRRPRHCFSCPCLFMVLCRLDGLCTSRARTRPMFSIPRSSQTETGLQTWSGVVSRAPHEAGRGGQRRRGLQHDGALAPWRRNCASCTSAGALALPASATPAAPMPRHGAALNMERRRLVARQGLSHTTANRHRRALEHDDKGQHTGPRSCASALLVRVVAAREAKLEASGVLSCRVQCAPSTPLVRDERYGTRGAPRA